MPIYNGEKYLEETIENLLKQTYKNFEIICIDDASTDATLDILKKNWEADERIRISKNMERAGAAFSRNKGIYEARGKYITFLDGDDIFEEEMLESAYKVIEKWDTDIVIYGILQVPSEDIYEKRTICRSDQFRKMYCTTPFSVRQYPPDTIMNWGSSPCNKLYRKSFIEENKLEFQSLQSANDVYFVNMALLLAKKVIMLDNPRVMVYARDHNVKTRISYDRDPMCAYQAAMKLGQELASRGLLFKVFRHYYCLTFFLLKFALKNTRHKEKARQFYDFMKSEGIDRIRALSEECYCNRDVYTYRLLESFKYMNFNSAWWQYVTVFAYRLNVNVDKVLSMFRTYEAAGKRIALWGAGINGKNFLNFLCDYNLKVAEVVDKDEKKQGGLLEGYIIKPPEKIAENIQVVMVCTSSLYQAVKEELQGTEIEVVCVDQVLQEE